MSDQIANSFLVFQRRCLAGLVLGAVIFGLGCAAKVSRIANPDGEIELADNEGLVVLHVDSEVELKSIQWYRVSIPGPIKPGKSLWVARAPADKYHWHGVVVQGSPGYDGRYRIDPSKYSRETELDIEIRPGVVNYIGELIIDKASSQGWYRGAALYVRVRNHAAATFREIERLHPTLLDRFDIHFAGASNDPFLEFYQEERRRVRERPEQLAPQ